MPTSIQKTDAKDYIQQWLARYGGIENPKHENCYCGEYRIRYEACFNQNHFAHGNTFRCGKHSLRVLTKGTPYLCHKADGKAAHIIPDYVVRGPCPRCRGDERLWAWEVAREQEESEAQPNLQVVLAQEQLDLFRESKENQEAIRLAAAKKS